LPMELIATIIVPTLFLVVVLVMSWLDRSITRSFGSRKGILWGTAIMVTIIIGLSIFAQLQVMAKQAAAPPSPTQAQVLAMTGEPATSSTVGGGATAAGPSGGAAMSAAAGNGSKIFQTNCSSCH